MLYATNDELCKHAHVLDLDQNYVVSSHESIHTAENFEDNHKTVKKAHRQRWVNFIPESQPI